MTVNNSIVMSTPELLLWTAAVGAIGLVVLLALGDLIYSRTRAAARALVYLGCCWVFVALFSGLAAAVWPRYAPPLSAVQILAGPLFSALGSYWCNVWLSAQKRDRLIKTSLLVMTLACVVGGPLCFLLIPSLRLPASAALSIATLSVSLWLSVRAAQLGDRLAWGLAIGCAMTLPMEIGLYAMVLDSQRPSLAFQAGVAATGILSIVVMAVMLWLRNRHTRRLSHDHQAGRDPITRLHSSKVIVQKIIHAQERRSRTRRDGALLAVLVFEPERLVTQIGQSGLNDIYIQLARRMLRHTGVVNPAGRYYDRCFMVLIETLHSPRWLCTLSLRVASSLRRPFEVVSLNGEKINIKADISVGIVHLSTAGKNVDQLLHEVQTIAYAARSMRSRAALLDPASRQVVPVESVDLGDSWRAMKAIGIKAAAKSKKDSSGLSTRAGLLTKTGPVVRRRSKLI